MEKNITNLVEKAMKEDRTALEELLEIYFKDILYFAAHQTNRQEAEDITQEVILKVFQDIPKLKAPDKFRSWLMRIVFNTSSTYMKKMRVIEHNEVSEIEDSLDQMEFLPAEYTMNKELQGMLMEEIEKLPDKQRVCIFYYYLYNFKRKDISDITGLTPRQVSTGLNYGKVTLKKRLEKRIGTDYAFSVLPAGTVPVLTQVLKADQNSLLSSEWGTQIYHSFQDAVGQMKTSSVPQVTKGPGTHGITMAIAGIAAVGVITGIVIYGKGQEAEEAPQVVQQEVEMTEEPEIREPEAEEPTELAIETLIDMIGQEHADRLEQFVGEGGSQEELEVFLNEIGAEEEDIATEPHSTYRKFVLEKQDKRLIIGLKEPAGGGGIKIRYWFGSQTENDLKMMQIILLLDSE